MAEERTIRVQGHGEVQVAADRARVMLGVHTVDPSVQTAVESNSGVVRSVLAALKEADVPDDAIQLSQFNVFYQPDTSKYQVNNQISLEIQDVSSIGRILATAIRAGANVTGGVTFEVADSTEARAEALRRAVDDARSRAETLAASLGVAVGAVLSINDLASNPNVHMPAFSRRFPRSIAGPAEVPVAGGELTIAAGVEVIYQIRPDA